MGNLRYKKENSLKHHMNNYFFVDNCRDLEKLALDFIEIERKFQFILCHDWENEMLKSIAIISTEHTLNTQLCNAMVHCHNEGYKKTYELLKHDLHKLLDPFLGEKRKNGSYCNCGDVPNPKACFTYGPDKFPPLKEQESIILAFQNEAQLIPLKPINLKMENLIDFIFWKEQSTYNIIVQQIMALTKVINKELRYDYNFPHYNELQTLQQPVEDEFEKLDSEYVIHSTILRPPITQDVDDDRYRKWKTYLSKWQRGFEEPICICTCYACDYDCFFRTKILGHNQGSWWAEQQIPRVLKCAEIARSKKNKFAEICNIHGEDFEFITGTMDNGIVGGQWSRIVPNKSK